MSANHWRYYAVPHNLFTFIQVIIFHCLCHVPCITSFDFCLGKPCLFANEFQICSFMILIVVYFHPVVISGWLFKFFYWHFSIAKHFWQWRRILWIKKWGILLNPKIVSEIDILVFSWFKGFANIVPNNDNSHKVFFSCYWQRACHEA